MTSLTGCFGDKTKIVVQRDDQIRKETKDVIRVAESKSIKVFLDPAESGKEAVTGELVIQPNDIFITESTFVKLIKMSKGYNNFKVKVDDLTKSGKLSSELSKQLLVE